MRRSPIPGVPDRLDRQLGIDGARAQAIAVEDALV